ncbi:uncharacterized protein BDW47DRAFT_121244 [Aspergillus candidus]|uniref:SNARE complex subunit n=1 Tax=Aspergillus candidus TaxID=41067 RepID=A0A2I2EYF1_ASPCN|nr:hypothetical protein BDW47DRAFT_121244 [Aspergillus candidus]PLB33411.1 hypothetical protein BDW47DRAFT_121244 [Aspergillus candidus]
MPDKRKPSGSFSRPPMQSKRSRSSYADDDDDEEGIHSGRPAHERPRNDPFYGQKSAFPGLDTGGDDELFYGPAEDGLEYLRMVRSEANSLPFLFTAPRREETETQRDATSAAELQRPDKDEQEVEIIQKITQKDEILVTTTATPATLAASPDKTTFSDAQASYYNLLHHRFLLLRSILKCTPPSSAITTLDDSHPITLPRHSKNACREWRRLLLAVDPQTAQLACMDMNSVLGVLGIMGRLMSENVRSGDAARIRRIGAWAWGLLAKCREVGQLGTDEVAEIRDLGKRSTKILSKMREEEAEVEAAGDVSADESDEEPADDGAAPVEEETDGNTKTAGLDQDMPDAEEDPSGEGLEVAKARLQARLNGLAQDSPSDPTSSRNESPAGDDCDPMEAATQTRAMLDMIITVVGEFYGQRDLLGAREILEISIPTTSISPTTPAYTIYNITLRLPLRSFTLSKRYSDFVSFHKTLLTQTNSAPPASLPSKNWFSSTVSNASLREDRRLALETYLRAINDTEDPKWRNSPAWRGFLNLPSAAAAATTTTSSSTNGRGAPNTSARLHAAITDPGAAGAPISDPTLWLDCYRDMKSHLHDARLHLTRRDQETTPQKQHESSARAKSSLVRAGTLIGALEAGLKNIGSGSGDGPNRSSGPSLGDGEMRRRKDLLINARKEKDGLEDLLNAMAAKSRVDSAVASIQDKEALVGAAGGGGGGGGAGRKPARSGRVLGRETERTRELDNQGLVQLQKQTMESQDQSVDELMKIVTRQKELGIAINNELELQNELLKLADEDAERLGQKVDVGKKRIGRIS